MNLELGKSDNGPFTLPVDLVTQTVAIVGMRGSGKTNTACVMAEGLLSAGQQVAIIDPLDVWWGLRSSANGRTDGFPVVVIGGEHADIPLEPGAGKAVADFVVEHRANIVISTRHLSKTKQRTFVADFAEHLYERKGKSEFKTPLQIIIDEADAFAPQRIEGDTARCFGAIDDLVRRGRSSGFGVTVITQRPAVLHKDILTQVEMLVIHRIVSPQDRKAIEAWVEVHDAEGVAAKVLGSLHTLKRGQAWIWSPSWMGVLECVQVNARGTFDSSYTPKVGEVKSTPKKIAAVDMEMLRKAMGETLEKAKANDPAELKRKIVELERQLKATPASQAVAKEVVKRVEVPVLLASHITRIEKVAEKWRMIGEDAQKYAAELTAALKPFMDQRQSALVALTPPASPPTRPVTPRPAPIQGIGTGEKMSKAERSILTALAQYPNSKKSKVSKLAGYAVDGGGFNNGLGSCRSHGWIEDIADGRLCITQDGLAALGAWTPLPTGAALAEYWLNNGLSKAEKEILTVLVAHYPGVMSKEAVAAETESQYSPDGGGFNNALGRLRTLELITGKGEIKASDELFD